MKTHLRVFAIVVFILVIGCGTASAYSKAGMQSVIIDLDGTPKMVSTDKGTVGELLAEIDDSMYTEFLLKDAEESDPIEAMMTLSLVSVTEKTVATTATLPYNIIEIEDSSLDYGQTRVVQEGIDGKVALVSKEIYHGDELVDTEMVEEKILVPAQDEIVEVGSLQKVNDMAYTAVFQARATAYTPYDPGCSGTTATGTKAGYGTIAVDPNLIPLGSRVYIPGYGVGIAEDTGGAIKGSRVDVCYETREQALEWGVKYLPVYVLE